MDVYLSLTIATYCFSLFLIIKCYSKSNEVYDKLPEKIPVHFGLSGKPDRWVGKSKLSVYWTSALSFVMTILFLYLSWFLVYKTGDSITGISFISGLLNLSVVFMMLRINEAVIDVAQKKSENVWPYIKLPLVLVLLCSILPMAPMIIPAEAELKNVVFCVNVDENNKPIDIRNEFNTEDKTIAVHMSWRNLNGNRVVRYEWYDPDDNLDASGEYRISSKRYRRNRITWWRLEFQGYERETKYGTWKLKVYIDNNLYYEGDFLRKK